VAAWTAGTYIVPDETMIFWTGITGGHLTFIPRKPTSLGFLLKTLCCGSSGILLRAEISGRKEDMNVKKWNKEHGAATSTTLRLCETFFGSGRIVVADSWFGSFKTALLLRQRDLFSVMNVKTAYKRFPKTKLRE
jgi:hypothetical protein